jgi:hypothetical protein
MMPDLTWEETERTRPAWAEVMFLHMRELRYGISPCKDCGKELILDAQWQAISWRKQKKIDDALP